MKEKTMEPWKKRMTIILEGKDLLSKLTYIADRIGAKAATTAVRYAILHTASTIENAGKDAKK